MVSEEQWIRSEIKEVLLYIFLVVFFAIGIPLLLGFTGLAFEEEFVQGKSLTFGSYLTNFVIYNPFLIVAIFLIIYPLMSLFVLKRGDDPINKKPLSWIRVFTVHYIFNPEQGGLWKLSESLGYEGKKNFMKWSLNPLRVFIVSIVLFGIYGLFLINNPQIAISGVPQLQVQQITPASEIAFGSLVPAFAENGFLLFFAFLFFGIAIYIAGRFKLGWGGYFMMAFFISILMGAFWMGLHLITYSNSEASLLATFIFGFFGTLLTVLTGTFIPFLIWHIMNNAFIKLNDLITFKEDIMLISIISLILLVIIWIWVEVWFYKRRKRKSELSIPES